MSLHSAYARLLKPGQDPYPYQIDVGRRILAGESLALRAPTGCGKTLSVLAPFLVGKERRRWNRLIYALPLRSLVNSIHAEATRVLGDTGCVVKMQTGEHPEDPFFTLGDVVVTTYDQVLSGLLSNPYGLSSKLHNINSASIAGALLVFDEFHLMEIDKAFLTAISCGRLFHDLCQTVWMTATATSPVMDFIQKELCARAAGPSPAEIAALPSVSRVRRILKVEEGPLTAAAVIQHHRKQSLVVVNQVAWAQQIFRGIACRPVREPVPRPVAAPGYVRRSLGTRTFNVRPPKHPVSLPAHVADFSGTDVLRHAD